jgi:L-asparaginase
MKRIFCLYTGGTIGCTDSPNGLIPMSGILPELIFKLNQQHIPSAEITLHEYSQALDSSSIGPQEWHTIAEQIASRLTQYDAFIILHGTDTMAWTGAALHWQLAHLPKPVILTGAQRPWIHAGSDAPANMRLALDAACSTRVGVYLAFGGLVLPAYCIKKLDADADMAYGAPNQPVQVTSPVITPSGEAASKQSAVQAEFAFLPLDASRKVLALKLYPGCEAAICAMLGSQHWDGIVLESYGSGNLPNHAALINALRQQANHGCVIINCTQCIAGEVRQGLYAAGDILNQMGAWPAGRRTVEAASTWLYTHLGRATSDVLRQQWQFVASL